MEIRPLTAADAAIYRALRLRALREHPDAFATDYEEEAARPLEVFAQRLGDGDTTTGTFTLGAFDAEGQLRGIVGSVREPRLKNRHRATLVGMYVAPEVRGRGVGRALVATLLVRVREAGGIEQVHLAVVTPNTPARALYRACGFESYGLDPHVIKLGEEYLDEDLMVCRLR